MKALAQVPVKYGALAGLLGAGLMIALFYMGRHPFIIPVFFDFRIFLFGVFIFFSLKEVRDFYLNGTMLFWEALIASFVFVVTYAILSSAILWVFGIANNAFVQTYIDLSIEQIKTLPQEVIDRIGKDVYDRNLELLPTTNAFDLAALYFVQCFLIGTFISIILSVILRRQPKP